MDSPKSGYSLCGKQNITPYEVMNDTYFVSDGEWKTIQQKGEFDYVVIGSSYCALGFIIRVTENNPNAKILVLERGHYFHPCHFQNLPPVYRHTRRGPSETFQWRVSEKTEQGKTPWLHGMCNFFGGRSLFWNGWCPEPTTDEMEHWPPEVITVVHKYFGEVKKLMNVTTADKLFYKRYGSLQESLWHALGKVSENVDGITRMIPGPLSIKTKGCSSYQGFQKDAVPEKLLQLLGESPKKAPLKIRIDCTVRKIFHDGKKATSLETSLGDLSLGNAKLILAMGTLPPTTLMLNSFPKATFPQLASIGERYTAHFVTKIVSRVPRTIFHQHKEFGILEMAAFYISGVNKKSNHQFHIQIMAIGDTDPVKNTEDTLKFFPGKSASQKLSTSADYVMISCTALGQMDHQNEENWFRLNDGDDVTTNVTLQSVTNQVDNELWDTMDHMTYQIIENEIAHGRGDVEYWHPGDPDAAGNSGTWKTIQPTTEMIRKQVTVHEASTMWIGGKQDQTAPVDLDYRPKGVDNIYITGASLYPTGASWNPTGVMVAMAMHLGDLLEPKRQKAML